MVTEAQTQAKTNFALQFTPAVKIQPLEQTLRLVGQAEPVRLTGRVSLVSGRFRDKPVDSRDAVEARMGGR
jgi:hypothetical protein